MNQALPMVYLVRHGDTAWTQTAQHTGRTDLPLTERGERQARELGASLTALRFDRILSSPLERARRTAELAMPHSRVEADDDLMEWDYGSMPGMAAAPPLRVRNEWTADMLDANMSSKKLTVDTELETLQRETFGYFLYETNPANGLVIDKTAPDWPASIAATGLALAAYPVGVERGFLSRAAAVERTLATLRFFWNGRQGPEPDGVADGLRK